jgi:hypothetical protein
LGGVVGALIGGRLTDVGLDFWCFASKGMLGLLISLSALTMPKSVEKDNEELINAGFTERARSNYHDIKNGLRRPELWKTIVFYAIYGCLIPSFTSFLYYYMIEVSGFTQL